MMKTKKLRVVFDCMIFIQAILSDTSPAAKLLDMCEADALALIVSREVLAEVQAVLSRPQLRAAKPSLTDERIEAVLQRVARKAVSVTKVPHIFTFARDPKDEKYVNLAIAANADYIVSRDTDLLELMTGYTDECKEFRQRFRPLRVVDPVEFLRQVEDKGRDE